MRIIYKSLNIILLVFLWASQNFASSTIKILPLGNSITYDSRSNDTRSIGEKAGYRGPLYDLLKNAGFNFDFIGSEHSGGNFLPANFDEHGGFPGISDDQLLYLLQTGHLYQPSQGIDLQVSPGPYLETFEPDVILLHIGTNGNDDFNGTSPDDIEGILDEIDKYEVTSGNDVIVLIARIIDRVPRQSYVTELNNNIEAMVNDRKTNPQNDAYPDNIVIVDMQDSANIQYKISNNPELNDGDMSDHLHPNENGYLKMAQQWFNAIKKVLPNPPIITVNPKDNYTIEGETAKFSIKIKSDYPFSYQWYCNNNSIALANDSVLYLTNVGINDNGKSYTCKVTNINGSVKSSSAVLYVSPQDAVVTNGVLAQYNFQEQSGNTIYNISNSEENLDLFIEPSSQVMWKSHGLQILGNSNIESLEPLSSIVDSFNLSNEFTFELWLSPVDINQIGPARILTISNGISERNFTIGQENQNLIVRTRTTQTDNNGLPEISSDSIFEQNSIYHFVVTRNKEGLTTIYVNGQKKSEDYRFGTLENWDSNFKLGLGNEFGNNLPWIGTLYYLAIFNRTLNENEIVHNFSLGETGVTSIRNSKSAISNNFKLFGNYPNPFNPTTKISFYLSKKSDIELRIYDMLGREISTIKNYNFPIGYNEIELNARNFSSGIYIYSLKVTDKYGNSFLKSKKMTLLK